jgi:hypothetical protein
MNQIDNQYVITCQNGLGWNLATNKILTFADQMPTSSASENRLDISNLNQPSLTITKQREVAHFEWLPFFNTCHFRVC